MKRVIIGVIIILFASIFFTLRANTQLPHEGNTEVALCTANIYEEAKLAGSVKVLSVLHKGDEFVLTGNYKSADNGKGARYTLWEGTTADGTRGWVKSNAFVSTDKYGW